MIYGRIHTGDRVLGLETDGVIAWLPARVVSRRRMWYGYKYRVAYDCGGIYDLRRSQMRWSKSIYMSVKTKLSLIGKRN